MKGYQKERASVNGSIKIMDMEPLAELASEGLLALSLQVGLEAVRCWPGMSWPWPESRGDIKASLELLTDNLVYRYTKAADSLW